LLTHTD